PLSLNGPPARPRQDPRTPAPADPGREFGFLASLEAGAEALEGDHRALAARAGRRDDPELPHEPERVVVRAVAGHEAVAEPPVVDALEHDRLPGGGEARRVDRARVRAAHQPR